MRENKNETVEVTVPENALRAVMESAGEPTLKALAHVFDLNPIRLYTVAKQPKEGEIYDARVYNWDAIERFITRRLDPAKYATLEAVVAAALEADEEFKKTDNRRGEGGATGNIIVDGVSYKKRRFETFEVASGKHIVLKNDASVYKIVYQTISHTVLVPVKADGEIASQDVKVISNSMLNMKGIAPSQIDAAVATRFDGTYVVPTDK